MHSLDSWRGGLLRGWIFKKDSTVKNLGKSVHKCLVWLLSHLNNTTYLYCTWKQNNHCLRNASLPNSLVITITLSPHSRKDHYSWISCVVFSSKANHYSIVLYYRNQCIKKTNPENPKNKKAPTPPKINNEKNLLRTTSISHLKYNNQINEIIHFPPPSIVAYELQLYLQLF